MSSLCTKYCKPLVRATLQNTFCKTVLFELVVAYDILVTAYDILYNEEYKLKFHSLPKITNYKV